MRWSITAEREEEPPGGVNNSPPVERRKIICFQNQVPPLEKVTGGALGEVRATKMHKRSKVMQSRSKKENEEAGLRSQEGGKRRDGEMARRRRPDALEAGLRW